MSLDTWLWTGAVLLASVLLISTVKIFVPRERIAAVGGQAARWVLDFRPGTLRAIGVLEVLAVVGLILPALVGIAPVLVPVTAICVALLFTGAVAMRWRRGERATIAADVFYLAIAVFVAWGRLGPERFTN